MNFFRKHLNMHGKIVGLVRDEYLEVPAEALREAVLNMILCKCLHNSVLTNLSSSFSIFSSSKEGVEA